MRVLLTGAAGFVGTAAVEVVRRHHTVRLFDAKAVADAPEAIVGTSLTSPPWPPPWKGWTR